MSKLLTVNAERPKFRRVIIVFVREGDWKPVDKEIVLTDKGEERARAICDCLHHSPEFLGLGNVRILAEDHRLELNAAAMALSSHLDTFLDPQDVFGGYSGLIQELQNQRHKEIHTLMVYVHLDSRAYETIIRSWNGDFSLFGYPAEFYPPAGGIPLFACLDYDRRSILWLIE